MFDEPENLSPVDKIRLLEETLSISDRNRSDSLRTVDPLRDPVQAYHLDLASYSLPISESPYKRSNDILRKGGRMAVVDTTYTASIDEMTGPITELTMFGLLLQGPLEHKHVGIQAVSIENKYTNGTDAAVYETR